MLKMGLVVSLSVLAILLGGISAAWRRACVHITRKTFGGVATLDLVHRMTPSFVAKRHGWALLLLFGSTILALILFTWKAALATFLATYVLMELVGFIFPKPTSMYYVQQLVSDCMVMITLHTRFGEAGKADDLQRRLDVVRWAYGLRDEQSSS
jgi:uncharacterized membrane-anchored protein YitT (DUF2179 family)